MNAQEQSEQHHRAHVYEFEFLENCGNVIEIKQKTL